MNIHGIPIIESLNAVTQVRVRPHIQNRTQRDAYHARIDKKWRKRFGYRSEPAMYMTNLPGLFGGGGRQTLLVHPTLIPAIRAATGADHDGQR